MKISEVAVRHSAVGMNIAPGLGPILFGFLVIEALGRGSRIPAGVVSKGRFWPEARSMGGCGGNVLGMNRVSLPVVDLATASRVYSQGPGAS